MAQDVDHEWNETVKSDSAGNQRDMTLGERQDVRIQWGMTLTSETIIRVTMIWEEIWTLRMSQTVTLNVSDT